MLPGMRIADFGASESGSGGGAPGTLDTQTVNVGGGGSLPFRTRGWNADTADGGCDDGTSNLYSGATIFKIWWEEDPGQITFEVGGTRANSGWTTMTVGSTPYSRASATFQQSGGRTRWIWTTGSNAFGSLGASVIVAFD